MTHPCPVCGKQVKVVQDKSGFWPKLLIPTPWLAYHFTPGTRTPCTGSRCGVMAPVEIPNYPSRGNVNHESDSTQP